MATVEEVDPSGVVDAAANLGIVAVLVAEQRTTTRTGFAAWCDLDRVGQAAGFGGSSLAAKTLLWAEVERAEQQGLLDVRVRTGKPYLLLTDLGAMLFGVETTTKRPRVEPGSVRPTADGDVVDLLARWPSAFPFVQDLADHLGRDVEDVWVELQRAERAGLVETWPDHPAAPAVMLSSLAASRAGLRLASDGSRWLGPRDHDPTSIDPAVRFWTETDCVDDPERPNFLDAQPDPGAIDGQAALEAVEAVEAVEAADRRCWAIEDGWFDQDDGSGPEVVTLDRPPSVEARWAAAERQKRLVILPAPQLLLGLGLAWPILTPGSIPSRIWRPGDGPCPVCHERPLSRSTLCLLCLRSGLDGLISEMNRRAPLRSSRPRVAADKTSRSSKAVGRPSRKVQVLRGGLGS